MAMEHTSMTELQRIELEALRGTTPDNIIHLVNAVRRYRKLVQHMLDTEATFKAMVIAANDLMTGRDEIESDCQSIAPEENARSTRTAEDEALDVLFAAMSKHMDESKPSWRVWTLRQLVDALRDAFAGLEFEVEDYHAAERDMYPWHAYKTKALTRESAERIIEEAASVAKHAAFLVDMLRLRHGIVYPSTSGGRRVDRIHELEDPKHRRKHVK